MLTTSLFVGACFTSAPAALALEPESDSTPKFTLEAFSGGSLQLAQGKRATRSSIPDLAGTVVEATLPDSDSESALIDASLAEKGALAASGPGFVDLSWEAAPEAVSYNVFRDDVLLAQTSTSVFRDTSADAGATYDYRIETLFPENSLPTSETEATIRGFEVYVPASTDITEEAAARNAAIAARAANVATSIQYKTFIPQAKLKAPPAGCTYGNGYQFGGDNRSYSTAQVSSRTNVGASVGWSNGSVNWSAQNGATTVYDSKGKLVASKTASTKDMWVKKLGGTSSYVDLRFSVKSGNPFCTNNSIQGVFTITVTKNGSYSIISGSHRQMPNHEIYVMGMTNMSWKTVYRRAYASELCLIAWACQEAKISGNGTY